MCLSDWYFERDGRLFCKDDYWSMFGESCNKCGQIISGPVMVSCYDGLSIQTVRHWHCWLCCGVPVRSGRQWSFFGMVQWKNLQWGFFVVLALFVLQNPGSKLFVAITFRFMRVFQWEFLETEGNGSRDICSVKCGSLFLHALCIIVFRLQATTSTIQNASCAADVSTSSETRKLTLFWNAQSFTGKSDCNLFFYCVK